ncbi:fatty-acid amide hydrolase 2-A-like [Chelonus insularis]|uniref:fatty-acid amide hydrolase 2-A-like n=1 Tax=Chelonus insularis TaxID=460826 RepID=UPI001588B2FB|nr:fatty-acid amide hydrolase 2-A-like [Chelonus insularis]
MRFTMLRVASWISTLMITLLKPFFWFRDRVRPFVLPPAKNQLLSYSACELAKKIRLGQVTCEAVVQAYIDRIKEVNPYLNAMVDDRFDEALNEAKVCDKILKDKEIPIIQLEKEKPLFGIPFTVKECCSVKGLSYTGCTVARQDVKADEDSPAVQNMRKAGAIPLCVTNTPELCSGFESTNPVYGITRNPYDGRHSAGGSSGGEGALLGAGASLIGIGSDIAGSIRVPSCHNGIFGHKPTPGIIPIEKHFPIVENEVYKYFLVMGPMARYVEDLHLAVKTMSAGYAKKDLRLDEPVKIDTLKVHFLEIIENNFGVAPVNSEIRSAIRGAAMYLESQGAKALPTKIEGLNEGCEVLTSSLLTIPNLPRILIHPNNPDIKVNPVREMAKAVIGCSTFSKSAIFMQLVTDMNGFMPRSALPEYRKKLQQLQERLLKLLGNDGVLLFPTWISAAPPIGHSAMLTTVGEYCLLANACGLPSTQVPVGLNNKGLPLGFQVIAAPYQDRLCLAVAKELEKGYGGWTPPLTS